MGIRTSINRQFGHLPRYYNTVDAGLNFTLPAALAYWHLSESSGSSAADSSGNSLTGTLLGDATFDTGAQPTAAHALTCHGTNGYMDAGNVLDITGSAFSCSCWISWVNRSTDCVIASRRFAGAGNLQYQFWLDGAGSSHELVFLSNSNGLGIALSTGTIPNSNWYHVAVVWNGATCKFYINGAPDSSSSLAGTITSIGGHSFRCGSDNSGGFSDAQYNYLRMYDVALTDADVAAIYAIEN